MGSGLGLGGTRQTSPRFHRRRAAARSSRSRAAHLARAPRSRAPRSVAPELPAAAPLIPPLVMVATTARRQGVLLPATARRQGAAASVAVAAAAVAVVAAAVAVVAAAAARAARAATGSAVEKPFLLGPSSRKSVYARLRRYAGDIGEI